MKKLIEVLILTVWFLTNTCLAQEIESLPTSIRTPEQLASWLSSEFKYQMKIPDKPQSVSETLSLRKGDCDDFARISSAVLSNLGINNEILIIKFKGLNIFHAICAWKDADGTYSFISNNEVRHTGESDIMRAVQRYYPDCEKIFTSNERGEHIRTIADAR